MTQAKVGWSLVLLCVLAASACSSKSVDDGENKGGMGTIINGGSSGSGGSSAGSCAGTPISCVDAATARACNPNTDMIETAVCSDIYAEDGLISNGCSTDAEGNSGCTLDDFADVACVEGVGPFGACAELADDELLNAYVACFHDTNGAHTIIPCFSDFVDDTVMPPTVDCAAAEMACLPADTMP